ncbi:MAG: hypothetical protein WKF79_11085 [Nocardioides sp.]
MRGSGHRLDVDVTGLSVEQASSALQFSGWAHVGSGDLAIAFADPTDTWCVRLTPFDPAYQLFADDVLAGPPNRWLPRMVEILSLAGEGYAIVMERLWSADQASAQGFCDALGLPSPNDDEVASAIDFADATDPDFVALRRRIEGVLARGASRYPRLWGGSDVRAGNVMADAVGALKLVDPAFLAGRMISDALRAGQPGPLAELTRAQLEAFLTLPCFHRVVDRYEGVEELRACLDRIALDRLE